MLSRPPTKIYKQLYQYVSIKKKIAISVQVHKTKTTLPKLAQDNRKNNLSSQYIRRKFTITYFTIYTSIISILLYPKSIEVYFTKSTLYWNCRLWIQDKYDYSVVSSVIWFVHWYFMYLYIVFNKTKTVFCNLLKCLFYK